MDGSLIKRVTWPSNIHFYQVKRQITISEVGFNGIVDIGWVAESQRWTQFKSNDGALLNVTQAK